jgi:hypothetical protein
MKTIRAMSVLLFAAAICSGQTAATARKKLLVIGEEKGYRHESVSHAMATIERLGRETGLWDTWIRIDTEALTPALPAGAGNHPRNRSGSQPEGRHEGLLQKM